MNVLTRGMRNAFRNGIRTFSIIVILALSIALALAMVIARGAVQKKIDSVKSSVGTTITISPAGVQGFEGGGEPLTTDAITQIKSLDHVASVTVSMQDRLTSDNSNLTSAIDAGSLGRRFNSNNGESVIANPPIRRGESGSGFTRSFTPPVIVSASDTLSNSVAATDGKVNLTSGALFAADSSDNIALVGKTLATKNNLSVGSTFTAYGASIKVVGIYDTGTTFSNNTVVLPLKTLQTLSGQTGQISSATVSADSITNVSSLVTAIKSKLGSTADVTSQQGTAETALAPLENIKTISLFSLIGAIVAGSAILLLTMVMIVRERRREIGVLKAIGASNLNVVAQFMSEAVTFTIIAAAVGVLLGVVGANPITQVLVNNSESASTTSQMDHPGAMITGGQSGGFGGRTQRFTRQFGITAQGVKNIKAVVGWDVLAYGIGAAVFIAMVGSAVAALLIAKIRPAEVMRAE